MFKSIPGTKDILPEETSSWQKIETISRNIFSLYNYQEIRTPVIENIALFNHSLGESTEIVQKQMFVIKNKEDIYALRPEGTAAVVRAYIENHLDKTKGLVKFYYLGPMFRLERPQKGRLRQFHHLGVEVIGSNSPDLDLEIISLAEHLLGEWGISDYQMMINNLGCPKDKKRLIRIILKALKNKINSLCADCQQRYKHNVLRILDCKKKDCQEVVTKLDIHKEHLCQGCQQHFTAVKEGLEGLKINYSLNPYLVRGLDYYTRTVFEIKHAKLGAQDAVGAGGRYDNLLGKLGGPDRGAMGFAFGIERLILATSHKPKAISQNNLLYLIFLGDKANKEGLKLLDTLRKSGISCDRDYENKSLKGAMRKASDLGAKFVLILGEDELKKGVVTLKDMDSGEQKEIEQNNLIRELRSKQ